MMRRSTMLLLAAALSVAENLGGRPGGFVPGWAPTYDMKLSTVIQPCDNNELMSSGPNWPTIRSFGLIDIDWSNSKAEWINTKPMQCEENLLKQAELIKANNTLNGQKIWVYRNPVLAMPWMSSTAKIMNDPAYDVWFLKFKDGADGKSAKYHDNDGTYHNRVCDDAYSPPKCSELFHSQIQTMEPKGGHAEGWDPVSGNWTKLAPPDGVCKAKSCDCGRVPCGFYLFDHRQGDTKVKGQTLKDWFVHNMFVSPTGLESEAIDGFFVDDYWPKPNPARSWPPPPSGGRNGNPWGGSAGDLDGTEIEDVGLSLQNATDLYTSWVANMQPMVDSIVNHPKKPGFIWQMMNGGGGIWKDVANYTGTGEWQPSKANCAATLRDACRADSKQQTGAFNYVPPTNRTAHKSEQKGGETLGFLDFDQHLAAFLAMRGPHAWFGYGWVGCSQTYTRPKQLDTDFGVPVGLCSETSHGVFERNWTKAKVKLDCNAWHGTVTPLN